MNELAHQNLIDFVVRAPSWSAVRVYLWLSVLPPAPSQPKCKGSSGQGPVIPLIVEWKVTGAETVTLSTGGTRQSYPASGTETYVFGCCWTRKYTMTGAAGA